MITKASPIAIAAILALTACSDSGNQQSDSTNAPTATPAAEEEKGQKVMDTVEEMVRDTVAEVKDSIRLDTSSFDAFTSSLSDMKKSLSSDQAGQLSSALASLAKGASEKKGGLMDAAKSIASGKSMEETLYESLGAQLNGLSFEDILKLAG